MDLKADAEALLASIKAEAALTPEEAELVQAVIVDSASLAARVAAGEDGLEGEVALIKATALNMAEAKRARVQRQIEDFLVSLVGKIVTAALAA